jgi:hypothetical protein
MRLTRVLYPAIACACLALVPSAIPQHQHNVGEPGNFGKVNFAISCDAAVQPGFNRALAILHSFGYEKAVGAFAEVAEKDPACGMAYWGLAMAYYHPIRRRPRRRY